MLEYRWKTTGLSYFKIIFDQVVILIKLDKGLFMLVKYFF